MEDVIWKNGQSWRDLTDDIYEAKKVTVLTENGAIRLVDTEEEYTIRLPSFHGMYNDNKKVWLRNLWASPCGMNTNYPGDDSHRSTNIFLVLAGHRAEEASVYYIMNSHLGPIIPDHPEYVCQAAYCDVKNYAAGANKN